MIKICVKCKEPRENSSTKTGSYCKLCKSKYQAAYAKRTNYKDAKNRRDKLKDLVIASKDKPCADCGVKYPTYVMDFDHIIGKKLFNISEVSNRRVGKYKILAEIAKCRVVCANCHRERTFTRKLTPTFPTT